MPALVDQLHELRRLVEACEGEHAARIEERLERDLLPRTRFGDDWLVAAIVGPNNAGKSALFNGLCGADLSPSLPTGAATRRLVAAARPQLCDQLLAHSAGGRFRLVPLVDPSEALHSPESPADLLLARVPTMPDGLLLVDAPDFDSTLVQNREAAEAVLAAADVVLCVVTKHTYQNAQVVGFLERWLSGGRPWVAVYNEYPSAAVARAHTEKLAADIGSAPLARFGAPHDRAVAEGEARLSVHDLDGCGTGLLELLGAATTRGEWKRAALSASLGQLTDDVRILASELADDAQRHREVHDEVARIVQRTAEAIAAEAMPAQPFLAALHAVVDRRRNALRRRWHGAVRALSRAPAAVARALGRRASGPAPLAAGLVHLEGAALATRCGSLQEELARSVGPAARDRRVAPELAAALDADLARPAEEVLASVVAAHRAAPLDTAAFQGLCEGLVERAIAERGHDRDVQALMDLATLLPVAAAAATVVLTGGFAVDIAIASSGVATTALLERYSHLFDRGIAREARNLWRVQRGQELAPVFTRSLLPSAFDALAARAESGARASAGLSTWLSHVS